MTDPHINLGVIKVHLPDENDSSFSIFEDLAELFGKEYQSEAFKLLKAKLKDLKPKPSMDYEADNISIRTTNIETVLSTVDAIIELSTTANKSKFIRIDSQELRNTLTKAKKNRPKPKDWNTGDVFSVPLSDNTFAFGQVLNKEYCTCALFDFHSNQPTINQADFKKLKPISILHLGDDLLNNGQWSVLFNERVTLDPNSGHGGKFPGTGSISYGSGGNLTDLAEAYWGIIPWNEMYEETYYDKMLLKNISRPNSAVILNSADRKKYRQDKYGIKD